MTGQRFLLIVLTALIVSGLGTGGWTTPGPASAHERDVEDVSVFYEPLAPYGTWTTVEEHGRVWVPRGVPHGWRPYTDGRWVYTDVGWTWVSDWEWGWAPFHYGRWSHSHHHGWYWVPGTVWGPAWVTWRHTPGWVGWAPLPPRVGFHVGIGLGAAHIDVDIAPHWFSFVEDRHILAPRVHTYFAPPTRNVHLVHVTQNVTNYVVINNRVVNRSVEVDHIERVTRRPVVRHRIVEVDSPERARGPRVRDREHEVVLVRPVAARERRDNQDRERHQRWERQHARERHQRHDDDRPEVSEIRERRRDNEDRARREPWERQHAREHRERRDDHRAGVPDIRERHREREEPRHRNEELSNERAAREERQRQERRNRSEAVSGEERRQRHEAEREAAEDTARRERQRLRQEQVREQRREERTGTTAEQAHRDRRARQQQPPAWQNRERHQLPPADQRDDRATRNRQHNLQEFQRSERPARPRDLVPEDRRERQGAVRQAVQEEDQRNHRRARQQ